MKIFNHVIEADLGARHKWTHFKIHKREMYKHLVWGKLSVIFGQPHLEEVRFCAECMSSECGEVSAGDESWTVCRECRSVEQGYIYMTMEEAEKQGLL